MWMSSVVFLLVLSLFVGIGDCVKCKNDPDKKVSGEEPLRSGRIYKFLDLSGCGNDRLEIDGDLEDRDYLNAYNNSFSELEANTFANIPNLVIMDLQNNKIKEISRETFTGLSKLTLLDLGKNSIEELKVGTFDPLIALKTLGLEKNKIKFLMEGIFDKNLNLDQIDLDYNEIFAVGPNVLKPGTALNLKGNKCADERFKMNDTNLVQKTEKCVENYREKFSEKCNLETI
jgi:hypothetical protein